MNKRSLALMLCFLIICSTFIPMSLGFRIKVSKIKQPSNIGNGNNLFFNGRCEYINYTRSSTDIVWDKTYGGRRSDSGNIAMQTTDGGYIFCGSTCSYQVSGEWGDGWIVKTDLFGNELWSKTYGGDDMDEFCCVQQTSDRGFILTGYRYFTYETGRFDLWLMKTDAYGTMEWEKTYGGKDWDMGHFVQQTSDGGYIIVGRTEIYSSSEDIWLVKTDAQGNLMWDKAFNTGTLEYGFCVQNTNDGGYILVGDIFSFGYPNSTIAGWAIKMDNDGNVEWDRKFWYGTDDCKTKFISQTSDGGYIISGGTACFGNTGVDAWLIRIDENGNEEWNKTYSEIYADEALCVQQTSDGGYIFTGDANGDLRLVKTDAMGNMEWDRRFGGSNADWGLSVQQVSDGGYIIGGNTLSYGAGSEDFWLIKTDENGKANESNYRPFKPMTPSGPTNGRVGIHYNFISNTIDSNGDMVYYWFDWGDGTDSGWIGPFSSGETVEASHTWTRRDEYKIHVKAMDEYGRESEWSDPLEIRITISRIRVWLRFIDMFPILQKIVNYIL